MRILVLNWRDTQHPRAGGAEVLTQEMARRWARAGDSVEWFTASFPGAAGEADLDGVRLIRAGRQWTVHGHALARYRGRLRGRFDVVVDEVNTIPFFTPAWAGIPVVMFIHQLAQEVWWYESRFPISALGFLSEPLYLRLYRRTPVHTVSDSTLRDLRRLGFRSRITIVPEGIEPVEAVDVAGAAPGAAPTFLYVGRLAPSKRVHHVLQAFGLYLADGRPGRLWLVGDGPEAYGRRLRALAQRLEIAERVEFCGRLPAASKHRRMACAHALLMTSVREGWGMVVTEAAACGTPAIVYDVAGLRDSVRHDSTGLVVSPSPATLAAAMRRLVDDPALRTRLGQAALGWSREFTFDRAAAVFRAGLEQAVG